MRYLTSPYKRAQARLVLFDLLIFATLMAVGLHLYPHRVVWPILLVWPALLFGAVFVSGGYDLIRVVPSRTLPLRMTSAVGVVVLAAYPFLSGSDLHRLSLMAAVGGSTAILAFVVRRLPRRRAPEALSRRVALLLESERAWERLEESRELMEQQFELVARERLSAAERAGRNLVGEMLTGRPDVIVCELGQGVEDDLANALLEAQVAGVRVVDFVDFYSAVTGRVPLDLVDRQWFLHGGLRPSAANPLARVRRVMSLAIGLGLLVVTAPLFLLVAAAIAVDSRGPIFFRQQRLGRFKEPFTLLKFRSMVPDAERDGPRWAAKDDPRVTRVGRILRRTRLDELPQLINLLRGELLLIGPRPIRRVFAERLAGENPFYDLRFLYPPGLTGWPQVLGPYGETADEHRVKLEMDIHYFRNAGLADDFYILLKTVQVVLRGSGV